MKNKTKTKTKSDFVLEEAKKNGMDIPYENESAPKGETIVNLFKGESKQFINMLYNFSLDKVLISDFIEHFKLNRPVSAFKIKQFILDNSYEVSMYGTRYNANLRDDYFGQVEESDGFIEYKAYVKKRGI